jgi:hypothetical protein
LSVPGHSRTIDRIQRSEVREETAMKGVFRSVALIASSAALFGVADPQASAKSATHRPEPSALAPSYAPAASGVPCTTTITRARATRRLSVGLACTSLLAPALTDKRPILRAGEALIESESGVYIVPPAVTEMTPSPRTASPAAVPLSY